MAGWPENASDVPNALRPYHNHRDELTVEDGLILKGEALVIPPVEREKILHKIHEGHQGITKCQYRARHCVYWPGINQDIKRMVESCATCQRHRPQEPRQPLKPTPAPERPWQHISADFFSFDGFEYLVIIDYYSKIPFIRRMPPSQCNAAKTISVLKELFSEHGIPETLRSDNGPQFASHLFAEFAKEWNFDHNTSSPRNPRSNGQAEAAVNIVKGLLNHAKYSGEDPYLALLAYRSTPIDAHLRSPADMLYQRTIHITLPQRICHKDPHAADDRDRLNQRATQSAEYHDRRCRPKSPLYAGQTVSVLNDARILWLPAKVIHQAAHGSYLVQVIGGGQYRHTHDHIRECHPDAVKDDTSTSPDVAPATPEALPVLFAASPPAAPAAPVAPATPPQPAAPTATTNTPCKSPAVPSRPQMPSTGGTPKQTSTAPAAIHQSTPCQEANF